MKQEHGDTWAYFDYSASTPPDAEIVSHYYHHLLHDFANSGSAHALGRAQAEQIATARADFAAAIAADPAEIIFTSGATEADNLALKGAVGYHGCKNPRIITVQTEHKAILDPLSELARSGVKVDVLPVDERGLLSLDVLKNALQQPATLVSVMAVNNETGVLQPLRQIADCVHAAGGKFHVDAAQALGKIAVNARDWDADLISFSGHKCYAPKGVGALFVRHFPKMRLQAQMHGGGQERGLRSGTLPSGLIMAFCAAAVKAQHDLTNRRTIVLQHAQTLQAALPLSMHLNVSLDPEIHTPHILNIDSGLPAEQVLAAASDAKIALSAGSACQSARGEASHVLQAMGKKDAAARSLRVSLSHITQDWELARLIDLLQRLSRGG